jgi:hypothetical protein
VALVVHWHQRDVDAVDLGRGSLTPGDRLVTAALARARRRGLAVMMFPIVWVEKRDTGKWRGTLTPTSVDRWWNGYERFVLHYARLAEAGGATWLCVGSELGSTEAWRQRWYHLISRTQRVFSGRLTYSANWDHFRRVSFWRRLDAVGVNGYFALAADRRRPSTAAMTATWARIGRTLSDFARAAGKPLILTEVGYLSRAGSARDPWNYTRDGAVDLELQRRAYAAFAAAWRRLGDLGGVFFWSWNDEGGRKDSGYTPRGKPAERVLRRFFENEDWRLDDRQ